TTQAPTTATTQAPTTATTQAPTTTTTAAQVSGSRPDIQPVSYWEAKFDTSAVQAQCNQRIADLQTSTYGSHALYRSAYSCFDGLVAMWRATNDTQYLDIALNHVEQAISLARPRSGQYSDDFRGWEAFNTGTEQSLREAYLWRYVTVMLREMSERPTLLAQGNYQQRYDAILSFTETHVYTKWRTRTGYTDIYRSRTHMTSHWGHICMNLQRIATSATIRTECAEVVRQINNGMAAYGGAGLRTQLTAWQGSPGALHWSAEWGYTPEQRGYSNDTNHGSAEVGYMVEAFDYGHDFTQAELNGLLVLTHERILPTGTSTPPAWITPPSAAPYSPPSSYGNLFTEGFVKLGRHDVELQQKLEAYVNKDRGAGQLAGNGALNAAILLGESH
ncbi:MAG: hypothetical protein HKN91_03780, partial [Acidimicrobiia bacterium]|nr:hypothetical protein [Acidimicrobiia bacterium]